MAAVDSAHTGPKAFQVVYERRQKSGEVTQHTFDVEAYQREGAETMFHWRVEVPKDVDQVILMIQPVHH